ncbi:MAG: hypothetical protein IJ740_03650 [Ruminococcus sp.]|nr:hypothetical protein [Ruminococcus sp.]
MDEIERIAQEIRNLTCDLSAGDYKVIKCYEAQLVGEPMPYDMAAIHQERQAIRDRINYLQEQIKETEE